MSAFGDGSGPENLRNTGRAPIYIYREFIPAQGLAQSGILYPSSSPEFIHPATTPPGTSLPNDPAALKSIINTLQTELNATTSVNTHLAASTARLQAELNATTNVNAHLAATVARFQVEQSLPTPTNTTTTTTTPPLPGAHRDHPRTIASGRGAASPEVFEEFIKTNWHGRLGRTHMVDVDNLPASALAELDCLLRRKLNQLFPRGSAFASPDVDAIFGGLAALGLRLEDRGAYADVPVVHDNTLHDQSTVRRVKNFATHYYAKSYWSGSALETLLEVARYRGLIDDEGFLKMG